MLGSLKRKDPSCFSTSLGRPALREVSPALDKSASAFLPAETSQSRSDTMGPEEQPPLAQLLFIVAACLSTPERIKGHSQCWRWVLAADRSICISCLHNVDSEKINLPVVIPNEIIIIKLQVSSLPIQYKQWQGNYRHVLLKTNTCCANRMGNFKYWVWFKQLEDTQTMVTQWQFSCQGIWRMSISFLWCHCCVEDRFFTKR